MSGTGVAPLLYGHPTDQEGSEPPMTDHSLSRRKFIEASAIASAVTTLGSAARDPAQTSPAGYGTDFFKSAPIPLVRVGFVGCGLQGTEHLKNLLGIEGVELRAVCDIVPEKTRARAEACEGRRQA